MSLVENGVPFNHLPKKLVDKVEAFTEKMDLDVDSDLELTEVEVAGWRELRREIPIDEELVEKYEGSNC